MLYYISEIDNSRYFDQTLDRIDESQIRLVDKQNDPRTPFEVQNHTTLPLPLSGAGRELSKTSSTSSSSSEDLDSESSEEEGIEVSI